jgi:hypothetical protein
VRLVVEIALVVLGAIGVAGAVARLPVPPPRRRRIRSSAKVPPRPDQLIALERLVLSASTSALQAHAYLRPVLVDIAAARLAAHGRDLDRMPEASGRELLGDRLWDIVRPGRPFPDDRQAPGVASQELGEMLEVLERL